MPRKGIHRTHDYICDKKFKLIVDSYSWYEDDKGYCRATIAPNKRIHMHTLVWKLAGNPSTKELDHKNRNVKDNRLRNLRAASRQLQGFNRGSHIKNSPLPKGVDFKPNLHKPYQARIRIDGKLIFLGYFVTVDAAEKAYIKAKKRAVRNL